MATTLPANTTKVNFDAGTDDPKQARTEFATNADIQNSLKTALGDFAQFNNPAGSGFEVVAQGGGTPDDIRAAHIHERKTATYTAVAGDRSKLLEFDLGSGLTLDLTAAGTLLDGWFILVHNSGGGTLTIDPNAAELIDDALTITLAQNESVTIVCDGAAFWTVGKGGGVSLPRAYLAGLLLSHGTDTANDIDIAVGTARNADDDGDLTVSSAIGKQIDVSWASGGTPGTPTGGLSSSLTLADATWYHIHLILVSGVIGVGFDTSVVAANLIADHSATKYRRIGSIRRATATNFSFTQLGDEFLWTDPPEDVNGVAIGTTATSRTLTVPIDVQVLSIINFFGGAVASGFMYFSTLDVDNEAPSSSVAPLMSVSTSSTHDAGFGDMHIRTNTSGQIRIRNIATITTSVATLGYIDRRGRDD